MTRRRSVTKHPGRDRYLLCCSPAGCCEQSSMSSRRSLHEGPASAAQAALSGGDLARAVGNPGPS